MGSNPVGASKFVLGFICNCGGGGGGAAAAGAAAAAGDACQWL